jgi:hypothetical protein
MQTPRRVLKNGKDRPEHIPLADRFGGSNGSSASRRKVSWNDADPLNVIAAIAAIVDGGDAVMFGSTSDGGALVITVLSGTDRRKFYPDDATSIGHALKQIYEAYLPETERVLRIQETQKKSK